MSNTLRCLIADDEPLARALIKEYLQAHSDIEIINECDNGLSALEAITEQQPDIVFLDMQMPIMNGIEVLLQCGLRKGVIFSTAFDQFALQAFDNNAVDYLLKPYSQTRFNQALEKAKQVLNQTQNIDALLRTTEPYLQRLVIKDRGKTHIIPTLAIDYIEAEDDYIAIHTAGRSYLKTQRLSDIEQQLNPHDFVRIHRSRLIRLSALKTIERTDKDKYFAQLHSGTSLSISRTGYERLKLLIPKC